MTPSRIFRLGGGVELRLFDSWRECATAFPDGSVAHATREESAANRRQAAEDGYAGDERVFRHLVEHEAAHSLWARAALNGWSRVLRHEAGAVVAPFAVRQWEEACVLGVQRVANGLFLPTEMSVPGLRASVGALRRLREVLW